MEDVHHMTKIIMAKYGEGGWGWGMGGEVKQKINKGEGREGGGGMLLSFCL